MYHCAWQAVAPVNSVSSLLKFLQHLLVNCWKNYEEDKYSAAQYVTSLFSKQKFGSQAKGYHSTKGYDYVTKNQYNKKFKYFPSFLKSNLA